MSAESELILELGIVLALLLVGYGTGSWLEGRHFESLRKRELRSRRLVVTSFRTLPAEWTVERAGLVAGSCVISVDYFKRFLAALRTFVGGPVKSYEPLLDRARREAVLRMKEEAHRLGFDAILNLRIETSTIAGAGRDASQMAGVEVLAYGTGIRRAKDGRTAVAGR